MKWKGSFKLFLMVVSVLSVDFISKGLVNFFMSSSALASPYFPFGGVAVFRDFLGIDFCLHHVTNKGVAWGVGEGFQNGILFVRIAVIIGMLIYLKRSPSAFKYRYPLMLIAAGGIGNVLDYFIYGHVIDMFHFIFWGYSYPVFNVADSAIFSGIVWLLCFSFIHRKQDVIAHN